MIWVDRELGGKAQARMSHRELVRRTGDCVVCMDFLHIKVCMGWAHMVMVCKEKAHSVVGNKAQDDVVQLRGMGLGGMVQGGMDRVDKVLVCKVLAYKVPVDKVEVGMVLAGKVLAGMAQACMVLVYKVLVGRVQDSEVRKELE